ncbi:MAG TPA: PQQ-binding-like beta-propeller repeat protein, partial [Steroidobacteraceae bacterium]|nr:PQQ-binding-like beta-propeller repeat protein [Steroidobacteraceae bacterium]
SFSDIQPETSMTSLALSRMAALIFVASLVSSLAFAVDTAPQGVDRRAPLKPLPPGGGPDGSAVFKKRCASCHEPNVEKAPSKMELAQRWPDQIVSALTSGLMKFQGKDAGMTEDEIDAVATYITGRRPPLNIPAQMNAPACEAQKPFSLSGSNWNGWSPDAQNLRYQSKPGLQAKDLPRLLVKWSFTFIGGRYGQPVIVGGRVFISSSAGKVYSLDLQTGCAYWRFDSPSGVRTTIVVDKNPISPSGYAAYFGNFDKVFFAVDALTGAKLWETTVETHPRQVLTGSPVLYKDKIIVPVSTWEETSATAANYECCTARGSVVMLDSKTGKIIWKTYMLPTPQPLKMNSAGVQMYGPAGAAIWSTPTIDVKRKLIYVTTGDSFVDVPEDASEAVIALDLNTGAFRWKRQLTVGDVYLSGCPKEKTPKSPANCPDKNGVDSDFGAPAFLIKGAKGKEVLVAGQKSSQVYGLNPDNGKVLWETRLGKGSAMGGVEWGMATDGKLLFAANADIGGGKPGIHAINPSNGKVVWYTAAPKVRCAWREEGATGGTVCVNANSQAPSMIPGALIAGTIDGHLRAYDPKTGDITWDLDTAAAKYNTVNGYSDQPGGALDAGGAVVADGMLVVLSGYNGMLGGIPNNVILAFSVDGK